MFIHALWSHVISSTSDSLVFPICFSLDFSSRISSFWMRQQISPGSGGITTKRRMFDLLRLLPVRFSDTVMRAINPLCRCLGLFLRRGLAFLTENRWQPDLEGRGLFLVILWDFVLILCDRTFPGET